MRAFGAFPSGFYRLQRLWLVDCFDERMQNHPFLSFLMRTSADAVNGICDAAATIHALKTVLLFFVVVVVDAALSDTSTNASVGRLF